MVRYLRERVVNESQILEVKGTLTVATEIASNLRLLAGAFRRLARQSDRTAVECLLPELLGLQRS